MSLRSSSGGVGGDALVSAVAVLFVLGAPPNRAMSLLRPSGTAVSS